LVAASPLVMVAAQSRLEQAGLGFFAARWRSPSTPFRDEGQRQQSAGRGDPEAEVQRAERRERAITALCRGLVHRVMLYL
jgi:hypothetical protein